MNFTDNKKPTQESAFFVSGKCSALRGQGFNLCVQAALVTGGLVLVDNAFVGHAVDDRYSFVISRFGYCWVAANNCGVYLFDRRADERPEAGVVCPTLFRLAGAFPCLW